jgi:hypothetical protein
MLAEEEQCRKKRDPNTQKETLNERRERKDMNAAQNRNRIAEPLAKKPNPKRHCHRPPSSAAASTSLPPPSPPLVLDRHRAGRDNRREVPPYIQSRVGFRYNEIMEWKVFVGTRLLR